MRWMVNDFLSWNHRLLSRPIVSATLFRPSIYNGPLPRLESQPDHISSMIHNRRVAWRLRIETFSPKTRIFESKHNSKSAS
ncbi:hypothetical protein BJV78DRAFT_1338128 [Lactifluus subvellereus]|nr:hypothetical protein BJV78DRAFT_1338128 [Lactifluus subvellereus]